ncbi:hypothetical protein TNCV_52001 [Trichonephila clavipes]|nr:hypothetical protein TNCV_52001 [Trichonephila clavipes]
MSSGRSLPQFNLGVQGGIQGDFHKMKQKGCAAFYPGRKSISGESPTSFPEDTSMPYSGLELEPIRLQAECYIPYNDDLCSNTTTQRQLPLSMSNIMLPVTFLKLFGEWDSGGVPHMYFFASYITSLTEDVKAAHPKNDTTALFTGIKANHPRLRDGCSGQRVKYLFILCLLMSLFKASRSLLKTDLVISSLGLIARIKHELGIQTFKSHQWEDFELDIYTRAFGDRHFEPWSSDKDKLPHHANGRTFEFSTDLTCIAPRYGGSSAALGSNS